MTANTGTQRGALLAQLPQPSKRYKRQVWLAVLGLATFIVLYFVLLNAKASEQSARMVSMKNATDSAESLIGELKLEYNKLRQGNITKELLEIAGGQAG